MKFPQIPELFRVEDKFGSWPEVMKTHFASGNELDKLLAAGVSMFAVSSSACCRVLP